MNTNLGLYLECKICKNMNCTQLKPAQYCDTCLEMYSSQENFQRFCSKIGDTGIYIGPYEAAEEYFQLIDRFTLNVVINVCSEAHSLDLQAKWKQHRIKHYHFEMCDVANENLIPICENVYDVIKSYETANILVHCRAGVSRSVACVIYYLMRSRVLDYSQAYEYVGKYRDCIEPNSGFVQQLQCEFLMKKADWTAEAKDILEMHNI